MKTLVDADVVVNIDAVIKDLRPALALATFVRILRELERDLGRADPAEIVKHEVADADLVELNAPGTEPAAAEVKGADLSDQPLPCLKLGPWGAPGRVADVVVERKRLKLKALDLAPAILVR